MGTAYNIQVIIKQNLGYHSVMQINMPLGEGAGCYGLIQLPFIEISIEWIYKEREGECVYKNFSRLTDKTRETCITTTSRVSVTILLSWTPQRRVWTGRIKHILVRFQVTVNNSIVMQILQGQHGLSKIHPGHINRKGSNILQERSAIAS